MAYLTQDEGVQKQLKSSRLSADHDRTTKPARGAHLKLLASFATDDVVGDMLPVNGGSSSNDDRCGV